MKLILELCEKASNSKVNFSKVSQTLWAGAYKNRIDKPKRLVNTKCSDGYVVSIWYKCIHFPLLLNPAIHRMGNSQNILCPSCRELSFNLKYTLRFFL